MFRIVDITDMQRDGIMCRDENHFLDMKRTDVAPAKLTKTISAFANSAGGELLIGIGETDLPDGKKGRSWKGFANEEAANGHVQAFEQCMPIGSASEVVFLRCGSEDGLVLQITIPKTREIIYASDKRAYVRRNAQGLPCTSDSDLKRLRLDKGIESFESQTVNVDLSLITSSRVLTDFLKAIVPTAGPVEWIAKQLLAHDGKPTVAAVLLFSEEPQAALPKRSGIKICRYRTTDAEGTREHLVGQPETIEGCVYQQIQKAVGRVIEMLEGVQVVGESGLEPIKYPHETLHEVITNAVLHRDYSIQADVQIRVFDNRIEVESPGLLPGHVTVSNILRSQLARNGAIVRLINKFPDPPNKDVGEGLNTAFQAMKALRLKDPLISQGSASVTVVIRHERLASPEEAIMDYLATHSRVTNRIGREITGIVSENKMKEVFYRLRGSGLIKKDGHRNAWVKS